ncbi:LuxR C-terminal-related transcriptional regulator [Mariniflexile soesokkakense]
MLFIETSTVATHRKHILRKLEASSFKDLYKFAKAFKIVRF